MGNLSAHFDHQEFACKDRCGYGQPHPRLVARLETLRRQLGGKPIAIRSGLRCPPHNVAVGGASRSRHCSGEAVDLDSGQVTEAQARAAGFKGIGLSGKWVTHVDVRRSSEVVVWHYS